MTRQSRRSDVQIKWLTNTNKRSKAAKARADVGKMHKNGGRCEFSPFCAKSRDVDPTKLLLVIEPRLIGSGRTKDREDSSALQ